MRSKKILTATLAAVLATNSAIVCAYAEANTATPTWTAPNALSSGLNFTENNGVYAATVTKDLLDKQPFYVKDTTVGRGFDGYWLGFYVDAVNKNTNPSSTATYKSKNTYVADLNPDTIKGLFNGVSNGSSTDGQFWAGFRYDWIANAPAERPYLVYAVEIDLGSEKKYIYTALDCKALGEDFTFANACTVGNHETETACAVCGNKKAAVKVDKVTNTAVSTAFPAAFTGDKKTSAEKVTKGMKAVVDKDGNIVVTFDKTKAEIEKIVADDELLKNGAGPKGGVDPVYLNITTDIPTTVTADDFTWVSGYNWDEADHSFNFANGHIMLWLKATATDDTNTIKYKVGTGAEQTLTVKYEYTSPAFAETDTKTNVEVTAPAGVVPENVTLKIDAKGEATAKEASYDITFVDEDGKTVTGINGELTVSIPVPEAMKDAAKIYVYYKDGNKYEDMNAEVKDGKLVFKTTHNSVYVVTTEAHVDAPTYVTPTTPTETSKPADSSSTTSDTASSTTSDAASSATSTTSGTTSGTTSSKPAESTSTPASNPNTGVALAVAPIVLAGAAVAIISVKKRK